jgi:hypothetical protein
MRGEERGGVEEGSILRVGDVDCIVLGSNGLCIKVLTGCMNVHQHCYCASHIYYVQG